jgi:TonB family protein
MPEPMDSPRTTLSLGPFEISIRRADDEPRLGLPGSIVVHVLLLVIALLISTHAKKVERAVEAAAAKPPIPITFVNPLPPRPVPKPPQPPPTLDVQKPPPASRVKPLRMETIPEVTADLRNQQKDLARRDAGRRDTKPAGGEQGGPLSRPTPGMPDAQPTDASSSVLDEPKDLQGRLRDFRRAVEEPKPVTPKGPKGGGTGRGGVTMPELPPTGFGVGNLEFEGRDYDWESYGRQIHGIIWRAWHNRLLITSSVFERWAAEHRVSLLDHRNAVRFTILKSGKVVDVAIETSSGCYPLDDSATDALKEVVLPPLPDDFQRDSETVHARFIAEGEIRGMGVFLQRMKDAGYF